MTRYKLVVFDFDGTLADTAPWFIGILNSMAERHHFRTVTAAEIEDLRRKPTREILRDLKVRPWSLPAIARDLRRASAEAAPQLRMFAGVESLLADLHRAGIAVAIVSSNGESTIRTVLGPATSYVTHLLCGSSLFGKSRKLRKLMRLTAMPPASALAVGDEPRDIDAAKSAGMSSAAVTWGYAHRSALEAAGPTVICDNVEALRARLLAAG